MDLNLKIPNVDHLDQYFGVWAIEDTTFESMLAMISKVDFSVHTEEVLTATKVSRAFGSYETVGDTAIIPILGAMTKYGSSFSETLSSIELRKMVKNAATDPKVKSILMLIDSPGGSVSGTGDLASAVRMAGAKKPIMAYIEDLGASAAYWVASQAQKVFANPSALVGSIGTFAVVNDFSGQAAEMRVKVHVIRAGKFKGMGYPGTEITQEQLDEIQRTVSGINSVFLSAVKSGRGFSDEKIKQVSDGRGYVASEAQSLGLIDGIASMEEVLSFLNSGSKSNRREKAMEAVGTTELKTSSATPDELMACLPGADADFVLGQLKKHATLDQAQSAWMEEQNRRIQASKKETADLKTTAMVTKEAQGAEPLGTGVTSKKEATGDPVQEFNSRVVDKMKAGDTKTAAIRAVVLEDPELHRAYLGAYTATATARA